MVATFSPFTALSTSTVVWPWVGAEKVMVVFEVNGLGKAVVLVTTGIELDAVVEEESPVPCALWRASPLALFTK